MSLQLGLNFSSQLPEFFAGREMGEDALRIMGQYLKRRAHIQAELSAEIPHVRSATAWISRRVAQTPKKSQ